jgi:hypothetical protein
LKLPNEKEISDDYLIFIYVDEPNNTILIGIETNQSEVNILCQVVEIRAKVLYNQSTVTSLTFVDYFNSSLERIDPFSFFSIFNTNIFSQFS